MPQLRRQRQPQAIDCFAKHQANRWKKYCGEKQAHKPKEKERKQTDKQTNKLDLEFDKTGRVSATKSAPSTQPTAAAKRMNIQHKNKNKKQTKAKKIDGSGN